MIPLGGNTVFIRRDLLERIGGWDEHCLTEDAEIGLRLSVLGEPIRVVYDAQYVTREETPTSIASFIKQRTRWQQGFLQVLFKGTWLALPRFSQRLLAFYTLTYPFFQAILLLLWVPTILSVLWLRLPITIALVSFLPLYSFLFQFLITAIGAFIFVKEYHSKFSFTLLLSMALTFLPFQLLLGISAVRAVYREMIHSHEWEKTTHSGAHRHSEIVQFNENVPVNVASIALTTTMQQSNPLTNPGHVYQRSSPKEDTNYSNYPVLQDTTLNTLSDDEDTVPRQAIQKISSEVPSFPW